MELQPTTQLNHTIFDAADYKIICAEKRMELAKIFKIFGEENSSSIISKKIISFRKNKNIQTENLVDIINSVKKKRFSKIHNATKVFQALRIIVNNEISELINGLINSFKILPVGGMIVIVTFHSIEDKIVKFFLKNYSENKNVSRYLPSKEEKKNLFKLINKKPIIPGDKELRQKVMDKTDFLEDEMWDLRLGPGLWERFIQSDNAALYSNEILIDDVGRLAVPVESEGRSNMRGYARVILLNTKGDITGEHVFSEGRGLSLTARPSLSRFGNSTVLIATAENRLADNATPEQAQNKKDIWIAAIPELFKKENPCY